MIKTYTQVPEYYYKESRDFQLLGRIFEGVFNYSKTAIDTLSNNPLSRNSDIALMDLVTKTVGFESRHNYDIPNLVALANSFKSILRIKGTKKSIEDCVRLLLNAQNIYEEFEVNINTLDVPGESSEAPKIHNRLVTIYIPEEVKDVSLLEDMLEYVLPVGFDYIIVISSIGAGGIGAEAASVDSISYNKDSEGNQINYEDKTLGIITPGLVPLNNDELQNIEGVGATDNAVIIKPSFGE